MGCAEGHRHHQAPRRAHGSAAVCSRGPAKKADGVNWVGVSPERSGVPRSETHDDSDVVCESSTEGIACGAVVSGPISGLACAGGESDRRMAATSRDAVRSLDSDDEPRLFFDAPGVDDADDVNVRAVLSP